MAEPPSVQGVNTASIRFGPDMPVPRSDRDSRWFWDACRAHRLMVQRCGACGRYRMTPRPVCPSCHSFEWGAEESRGSGEIFTFTIVHHAAHPAVRSSLPYVVVVVRLEDCGRVKILSNLTDTDPAEVACGMPVRVVWEDIDTETTLHRFTPHQAAYRTIRGEAG